MPWLAAAEHFTRPPAWEWWIILYFFFAGIAGGAYVLGTLLRMSAPGTVSEASRAAFVVALVGVAVCPIFLTIDLGQPLRFWHMLIDTGAGTIAFKPATPMSVGAFGLLVFGIFAFVSALEAVLSSRMAWFTRSPLAVPWMVAGSVFGLFIAGYTGVLLAVSNQPVWSDGWPLGGLFLASGLSGAAAVLLLIVRRRGAAAASDPATGGIEQADRWFVLLEAVLVAVFLVTIAIAGTIGRLFGPVMIVLWLLVAVGLVAPWITEGRWAGARRMAMWAPAAVVVGVLALRAVVIFGPQT